MACALASTCFLNCLCSLVLVLLIAVLFFCVCCCVVLGGGASQRQRDERLRRLTLLSALCSLLLVSSLLVFLCSWKVEGRVVRAQPSEHARNTTLDLVFLGLSTVCGVCCTRHMCYLHTLFTVNVHGIHH